MPESGGDGGLLQETRDASRGGGWAPLNDDEINQTKIMKVISIATGPSPQHSHQWRVKFSLDLVPSCSTCGSHSFCRWKRGGWLTGWLSNGESQRVGSAHLHGRKWNNFSVPSRRLECCALCSMGPRHVHSIQSPISSLLHPLPLPPPPSAATRWQLNYYPRL